MVYTASSTSYTERQPTEDPGILWILWTAWRNHGFI